MSFEFFPSSGRKMDGWK